MTVFVLLIPIVWIMVAQALFEKKEVTKTFIFREIDSDLDQKLNRSEVFKWLMTLEKRKLVLESIDEWNDYKMRIKNDAIKWSAYELETFGKGK